MYTASELISQGRMSSPASRQCASMLPGTRVVRRQQTVCEYAARDACRSPPAGSVRVCCQGHMSFPASRQCANMLPGTKYVYICAAILVYIAPDFFYSLRCTISHVASVYPLRGLLLFPELFAVLQPDVVFFQK